MFVAVEDFAFARGFRAHQLGGLGYMVRLFLYEKGIPFVIVGTQQLKKFITGHAGAEKNTVVLHVFRRWEWEAKDDNEADATGLAHVGMCLCGLEKPTMVAQREVLDRLMHVVPKGKKGRNGS